MAVWIARTAVFSRSVLLAALGFGAAQQPETHPGILFPPQRTSNWESKNAEILEKRLPFAMPPNVDAYLTQAGFEAGFRAANTRCAIPVEFHCVNSKEINAFAATRGYVSLIGEHRGGDNERSLRP